MQGILIPVGKSNLGTVGRAAKFDEAACENALVGGAGDFVLYIGSAVEVVLAKIEYQAVNYDVSLGAGVTPGPSCVDVQKRGCEFLASGLDFGHMLDDVAL